MFGRSCSCRSPVRSRSSLRSFPACGSRPFPGRGAAAGVCFTWPCPCGCSTPGSPGRRRRWYRCSLCLQEGSRDASSARSAKRIAYGREALARHLRVLPRAFPLVALVVCLKRGTGLGRRRCGFGLLRSEEWGKRKRHPHLLANEASGTCFRRSDPDRAEAASTSLTYVHLPLSALVRSARCGPSVRTTFARSPISIFPAGCIANLRLPAIHCQ